MALCLWGYWVWAPVLQKLKQNPGTGCLSPKCVCGGRGEGKSCRIEGAAGSESETRGGQDPR